MARILRTELGRHMPRRLKESHQEPFMIHRKIPLLMPLAVALALGTWLQPAHSRPGHHAAPPHHGAQVTVDGQVQRLLTNPFGEVNGLLLADGRVVNMPPHMGEAVAAAVVPGQPVRVGGYAYGYAPGTLKAMTVTNMASGQTVVDQGPPWPRLPHLPPPPAHEYPGDA
jgi:hypothetical protein